MGLPPSLTRVRPVPIIVVAAGTARTSTCGGMPVYWQKDIETAPREDLERLQLERLRHTVEMASRAEFYNERFREAGFQPQNLRSLDDLRRIPFTTKEDLRSGFPYRFLCVGLEQCVRLHSSSGTTGRITVIFHTQGDIDAWTELLSRSMYATGMRTSDVFQNMMSYGLFTGGLGFHYGAERLGALVLPTRRETASARSSS